MRKIRRREREREREREKRIEVDDRIGDESRDT